ncbi:MAG: caspase family protein, partial [Nitrospinae bacterium]|nr:caspase family protein [Nitrospinota bacterium]
MKKFSLTILIFLAFFLFFLPFVQSEERSVTVKAKRDLSVEAKKGLDPALLNTKYHAIIIGNNSYKNLPKLKTAIADAKEVERVLKTQYGFETKLLLDATRNDILTTVNDFRKRLGSKDNLLIYYAGHGEFDKTADRAYWLPVNAQRDDPVDWISATDITDNIKRIASAHILIISDSCYSGTLTRAAAGDLSTKGERDEFVKKMMERRSRTLMASGGNEPVADEGGSGHSVFADAFLRALKEADKGIFTAEELFHGRVKSSVAGKSDQVPEYNDIKNSGHEGGDFVFKLANAGSILKIEPEITGSAPDRISQGLSPAKEISEELKNIQQEKERLKKEREELEQKKALMEEKNRLEEERRKLEKEKLEVAKILPPDKETSSSATYRDTLIEGDYWALIIGINEYVNLPADKQLQAAQPDAKAVADVLNKKYGFAKERMVELYDKQATRSEIIKRLRILAKTLSNKDNLMIYYTGHGKYDRDTQLGVWIPSDAMLEDTSTFISNEEVREYLKKIKARHIYMIADSCFSESLMGGKTRSIGQLSEPAIKELYNDKSRLILTSGGLYPVP